MRIVILCSSVYSETACAMAVSLARLGHAPVGALTLATFDRGTVLRKIGQWGAREVVRYARTKLIPPNGDVEQEVRNAHLMPLLEHEDRVFRSIRDVAASYGFPVVTCKNQNAPDSIGRLRNWSPDLIIFTGGNILRKQLLEMPRLGVINLHLGLLPEIRGMSSPEWSLLKNVPVGVTIHYIDAGIDTGPILQRVELPDASRCGSLGDLRNRLIAFGIEKVGETVAALDRGTISARPQSNIHEDNQFFVMHEWLQAHAAERLKRGRIGGIAGTVHG